jgi:hypothetical protein
MIIEPRNAHSAALMCGSAIVSIFDRSSLRDAWSMSKSTTLPLASKSATKPSTISRASVPELAIRSGLRRGNFAFGNGEKIFKRLINLARQVRAEISDEVFYEILSNWPGLRQSVLTWWQTTAYHSFKIYDALIIIKQPRHRAGGRRKFKKSTRARALRRLLFRIMRVTLAETRS